MTPVIGTGLTVPSISGVPIVGGFNDNVKVAARLARGMLDAGVADPQLWAGQASDFVAQSFKAWIQQHGGDVVDRRFDLVAWMDSALDGASPHGYGLSTGYASSGESVDGMIVVIEPGTNAGYLCIGRAFRELDAEAPGLAAAIWRAICRLHPVARIFDFSDAREHYDARFEGMDEEDFEDAMQVERKRAMKELEPPPCLRHRPLGYARLRTLSRSSNTALCKVASAVLAVRCAADRLGDPAFARGPEIDRLFYNTGAPLPALLVSFERGDAVCAAADDEFQYMFETQPSPVCIWQIDALLSTESIRRVFRKLADTVALYAAVARLMDALPYQSRHGFSQNTGRALVHVFEDDAERVRAARHQYVPGTVWELAGGSLDRASSIGFAQAWHDTDDLFDDEGEAA